MFRLTSVIFRSPQFSLYPSTSTITRLFEQFFHFVSGDKKKMYELYFVLISVKANVAEHNSKSSVFFVKQKRGRSSLDSGQYLLITFNTKRLKKALFLNNNTISYYYWITILTIQYIRIRNLKYWQKKKKKFIFYKKLRNNRKCNINEPYTKSSQDEMRRDEMKSE